MSDLFDDPTVPLGAQAVLLRGFALPAAGALLEGVARVTGAAPWRQMQTPGGFTMSVACTNCGALGWTSDRRGYRYSPHDPLSDRPWPAMPESFRALAESAARAAGFAGFAPDACLVNRYQPGARLSLHQDRDERDLGAPIVSVSLGLDATFLWGGDQRSERSARVRLSHGDVVVWGGVDRLRFHGVLPLAEAPQPPDTPALLLGRRVNLTFRQAG